MMIRRSLISAFLFVLFIPLWILPQARAADPYQPKPFTLLETPHFECSRYYGDQNDSTERRALTVFSQIVHLASIGKMKIKGGNSNRENAWANLAAFFAPLPQWRRAEVVLQYCHEKIPDQSLNIETCLHWLFNYNPDSIGRLKGTKMRTGLQMYDTAARMFQLLIRPKAWALGQLLFEALEPKVHLEALYNILLTQPKTELIQILNHNSQSEMYPFKEKLEKIYKSHNFDQQNEERPLLLVHLELKIEKEKNAEVKGILALLSDRLEIIQGRVDFYEQQQDMEEIFEKLKANCACPNCGHHNIRGINQLVENLERLLTQFEFKSEKAFEFGKKFQDCAKMLKEYKVVIKKQVASTAVTSRNNCGQNTLKNCWPWKMRGNHHQQQQLASPSHANALEAGQELEAEEQPTFSQFYWDQLMLMLQVAGLTAKDEDALHMELAIQLQKMHFKGDDNGKKRNSKGVIRFLVMHLGDDLSKILAKYPGGRAKAEKDLTIFVKFTRLENRLFDFAYRNILDQVWYGQDCYTETEKEYALDITVDRMRSEISKLLKLSKILIIIAITPTPDGHYHRSGQCASEERLKKARKYLHEAFSPQTDFQLDNQQEEESNKMLENYAKELRRHLGLENFTGRMQRGANFMSEGDQEEELKCLLQVIQEDFGLFCGHKLSQIQDAVHGYLGVESSQHIHSTAEASTSSTNNQPIKPTNKLSQILFEEREKERKEERAKNPRPDDELVKEWFFRPSKGMRDRLLELEHICHQMSEVLEQGQVSNYEHDEIVWFLYNSGTPVNPIRGTFFSADRPTDGFGREAHQNESTDVLPETSTSSNKGQHFRSASWPNMRKTSRANINQQVAKVDDFMLVGKPAGLPDVKARDSFEDYHSARSSPVSDIATSSESEEE